MSRAPPPPPPRSRPTVCTALHHHHTRSPTTPTLAIFPTTADPIFPPPSSPTATNPQGVAKAHHPWEVLRWWQPPPRKVFCVGLLKRCPKQGALVLWHQLISAALVVKTQQLKGVL
ncbi:hypothetical protein Tco_0644686 [Tanacetum coccineum]